MTVHTDMPAHVRTQAKFIETYQRLLPHNPSAKHASGERLDVSRGLKKIVASNIRILRREIVIPRHVLKYTINH